MFNFLVIEGIFICIYVRNCDKEVVDTMLHEANVEWKMWEDSMTVVTMLNSMEINDAQSRTLLFRGEKVFSLNYQYRGFLLSGSCISPCSSHLI